MNYQPEIIAGLMLNNINGNSTAIIIVLLIILAVIIIAIACENNGFHKKEAKSFLFVSVIVTVLLCMYINWNRDQSIIRVNDMYRNKDSFIQQPEVQAFILDKSVLCNQASKR